MFKRLFHKHKFEEVGRLDVKYKYDEQYQFMGSIPIYRCSICNKHKIQLNKIFEQFKNQASK